ncbi:MAG: sulfotransferase [Actinomycetota bacterium]|nr:sulfotransferase [Actinomycetota bacterium]
MEVDIRMKAIETPVQVLYVIGYGRSGSTLLDILLGNHPKVEGVGELAVLPHSGWIGGPVTRSSICACGRRVADCPFWSAVRREWVARVGEEGIERYPELQNAFEKNRWWPRLLRECLWPSPRYLDYARYTQALFAAIRATSGKEVVVDSSKRPLRAFTLSGMPGVDLRVVHLVRDGRGVVSSRKKVLRKDEEAGVTRDIRRRPALTSTLLWTGINVLSELIMLRLDPEKAVRVRYEDLVEDPKGVLGEIGRMAGLDLSGPAEEVLRGGAVEVGHNVGGNRLRMTKGGVRLRPDAGSWRGTLSAGEQRFYWALAGWLTRRYGYKK